MIEVSFNFSPSVHASFMAYLKRDPELYFPHSTGFIIHVLHLIRHQVALTADKQTPNDLKVVFWILHQRRFPKKLVKIPVLLSKCTMQRSHLALYKSIKMLLLNSYWLI